MRKKFGQHFIRSDRVARFIVSAAPIRTLFVVEIGPGKGVLTAQLLDAGHTVVAVEKDDALVAFLRERFVSAVADGTLILYSGDVRGGNWFSLLTDTPYTAVMSIPYYLTGSIIRDLLTAKHPPTAVTLVVQKEVAERISARNGKESLLSLSVALFGVPKYVKTLSRRLFSPQPTVDSAVLTITGIHAPSHAVQHTFFTIIHTAFHQKRKSVLKKFQDTPVVQHALAEHGVNKHTRAEDIPFAVWLAVAQRVL